MYKVEEWAVNWSLNLRDFSVLICVLLPILKQINTEKDAELETEAMVKDSIRFINFWCYIINSDLNLNLLFVCNWYMLLKKSTSFSPFCLLLLRCLVLSCLDIEIAFVLVHIFMFFDCSSLMNQNLLINCFRFRVLMSGSAVTSVFCCVGALAIMGSLQHIDKDLLV